MVTNTGHQIQIGNATVAIDSTRTGVEPEKCTEHLGCRTLRIAQQGTADSEQKMATIASDSQRTVDGGSGTQPEMTTKTAGAHCLV